MVKSNKKYTQCNRCDNTVNFATVTSASSGPGSATNIFLQTDDCRKNFIVPGKCGTERCICNATASIRTPLGPVFLALDNANNLIAFSNDNASKITSRPITGLAAGQTAIGIDFRPANGRLYLLANGPTGGQLYTLDISDPCTAFATPVSATLIPLVGAEFGFDFNPTVDRIRVVSNTGQNLRLDPDTGAIAFTDTNLAYAIGDPNFGFTPAVGGAAYTNSVAGALTTTLYVIDSARDVLAIQNPPNDGTLNTVGSLGINVSAVIGFDIEPITNNAYAVLTVTGVTGLYSINLTTGAATFLWTIGCGLTPLRALAIIPAATVATTINFTLLVNGSATNVTGIVPVTPGATTEFTVSNQICFEAGDRLSVALSVPIGTSFPSLAKINFSFKLIKRCC